MAKTLTEVLEEIFSTITGHKTNIYRAIQKHVSVPSGDDKLSRASYYIGKMNEQIESGSSSVSELQAELERVRRENSTLQERISDISQAKSKIEKEYEVLEKRAQEVVNATKSIGYNLGSTYLPSKLYDLARAIRTGELVYSYGKNNVSLIWEKVIYPNLEYGDGWQAKFSNGDYFMKVSSYPHGYDTTDYCIEAAKYPGSLDYIANRESKGIAKIKDVKIS